MLSSIIKETWQENLNRSTLPLDNPRADNWWTGKKPIFELCAGVDRHGKIHALPAPDLHSVSRQQVQEYFDNAWTTTEILFAALKNEESFYRPPYHGLRHPLVFYYVHPVVLYVNKLRVAGLIDKPVNEYFERLFETGVDEMNWDDMSKNSTIWPPLEQLHAYRRQVYEIISHIIQTHPGLGENHPAIDQDNPLWALFMGFEHERIHIETSSVLIRELPLHLTQRPPWFPPPHPTALKEAADPIEGISYTKNSFITVEQGTVNLGKPVNDHTYGWDNEYGFKRAVVGKFATTRFLISNGEYLQFVKDGGYQESRYWSAEGWQWRTFRNLKCPAFWHADGPAGSHLYKLRTLLEVIPMPWSWPAVVTYQEASAYCNWWRTKYGGEHPVRLLSESEHHRLRQIAGLSNNGPLSELIGALEPSNLNLKFGSESPVDEQGALTNGPCDVFGSVWQWLEDHFHPLPEFHIHRYYDDFSTPCFDGKHQMIMGGSFMSTGDLASPSARYHFRPHFAQHAGFRMAYALDGSAENIVRLGETAETKNPYDTESILNEYLMLHFGSSKAQMPFDFGPADATEFPRRCADLVVAACQNQSLEMKRALDIGCAVGGSTFALADHFNEVIGVDLSEQFIETAKTIQRQGQIQFKGKDEGKLETNFSAQVNARTKDRITFRQADACCLPADFVDFDAVLLANVLCRLPSPMACLSRLSGPLGIVKKGGILVITTPFTWMEKFTPSEVWLGGYIDGNGNAIYSEDGLINALGNNFTLLDKRQMPLIIQEHKRKYQYIVTLATIWQRKG
jgi:5-histidylcysteine sulfoxide synthase/putative 4-mercaptohistidine N1-methyltranferase